MRKKRIVIILLLLAILSFCVPSFSQSLTEEKMRVAVVEFDEKGDLGIPDAGEIIAEWVIAALVGTEKYVVEERPLLERILNERQLALTDIYELNSESLARLREEYKVDAVLVGAIMKFGDTISIIGKLVDIRSFEIISATKVSTTEMGEIERKVDELVQELVGVNQPPVIVSLIAEPDILGPGETATLTCVATDPDKEILSYIWSTDLGSIQGEGEKVTYQAPERLGTHLIRVEVADDKGGKSTKEVSIIVKKHTGNLKVTSDPSGADVYVNEVYAGQTPLTLSNIETGTQKVRATKGKETREQTIRVERNQTASLDFFFKPEPDTKDTPERKFLPQSVLSTNIVYLILGSLVNLEYEKALSPQTSFYVAGHYQLYAYFRQFVGLIGIKKYFAGRAPQGLWFGGFGVLNAQYSAPWPSFTAFGGGVSVGYKYSVSKITIELHAGVFQAREFVPFFGVNIGFAS